MTKQELKKLRAMLAVGTMLGTASLTGCGKKEYVEPTTEITTEATTEAVNEEEIINQKINKLAEESYETYKATYDYYNMDLDDVITLVRVINDKNDGLSEEEISDNLGMIQMLSFTDNTYQVLDNVNLIKSGFVETMPAVEYYPNVKLSKLIINEDSSVIEKVSEYEDLVNEVINEVATTGTYSEEMKNKVNAALIKQEEEYNEFKGMMDSDEITQGTEYVLAVTKCSLCDLTSALNIDTCFVEDNQGFKLQIRPNTDYNEEGFVESDIIAKQLQMEMNGMELDEDTKNKVVEIQMRLVRTKYENDECTLQNEILNNAGYGLNMSSVKKLTYTM